MDRVRMIGTDVEGDLLEHRGEWVTVYWDGAPTCCDRLSSQVELIPTTAGDDDAQATSDTK